MPNLARESVKGAAWLFGTGYTGFVINFIINLLIARLIFPEEYGIFVIAFAASELIGIVAAFSIPLALIHFDDAEPFLFDTGAWLSLALGALGLLLTLLVIALSPFAGARDASRIFLVLGLSRVVKLMSTISAAAIEKQFRYPVVSTVTFFSASGPNLMALLFAWIGLGAWSLAGREVLTALSLWGLYGWWSPFRFRGRFSAATARKIAAFSSRMFVSRGLQIVLDRFDRLILGALAGTHALGIYDRSRYISEVGMTISRPVESLSFNLYSRLRDDRERLLKAYSLLNYFVIRVMVVLALVFLFFPRETVLLLLGGQWLSATETLRVMAAYAALLPIHSGMMQLLYGRGMIAQSNRVRFAQVGLFVPVFVAWVAIAGAETAGLALLVSLVGGGAVLLYYLWDLLASSLRELYAAPAAAFGGAALVLIMMGHRLPAPTEPVGAAGVLLVPVLLYLGLLVLAERRRLLSRLRLVQAQLQG